MTPEEHYAEAADLPVSPAAPPFNKEAYRVYSRWVHRGDHSAKSVLAAIREAHERGVAAGRSAADAGRVVSAARAWRDGRRDRVTAAIYHRQCRDLYAAVNALDEESEPSVPRRVPTQAERIADAIADGHHRITEGGQTATDAMSDRYGEPLDLIAAAVETATDDTLRGSIRSMIRRVRPEAFDLWSAGQVDQAGMKSGMKSRPGSGMDLPRTQTDHCPATRQTGIAGMTETLTCNRGAGHDGWTHRDPVYGYWTHPLAHRITTTDGPPMHDMTARDLPGRLAAALADVVRRCDVAAHPGQTSRHTGWIDVATIDGWRALLAEHTTTEEIS